MQLYSQRIKTQVAKRFSDEFSITNRLAVPRVLKVTLSVGTGNNVKDTKLIETATRTLERITGQKPVATKARKSIAGFKIRQGMVVGLMVTLRGKRMADFIDRLIHVSFPRTSDFRGIARRAVDKQGNLSLGFKEHVSFPEIHSDEVEFIHGLQITLTTNALNRERGLALFEALGIPFARE